MPPDTRAFISYSWIDKPLARRVARRLRHSGLDVFLDETRLEPGMMLPETLQQEIARSTHVFVVWTAAAAASPWVAREIEFAKAATSTKIVPLLFIPPGPASAVANNVGIDFSVPHGFERSFAHVWKDADLHQGAAPSRDVLSADLNATLDETPSLAGLFDSPISRAVSAKERLNVDLGALLDPDSAATKKTRTEVLAKADGALRSWKPEGISTSGLPAIGEPDFHALDFAMWCASQVARLDSVALGSSLAPEVITYPPLFAKVLGITGAGFESIMSLLALIPWMTADALQEVMERDQIRDVNIAAVVELYDAIFQLAADLSDASFIPFDCAERFLAANLERLTPAQKHAFRRLATINGNGPYPVGTVDLLCILWRDPAFHADVNVQIRFWVEHGYFDGVDPAARHGEPHWFYAFAVTLLRQRETAADARLLVAAAAQRIRTLFRASDGGRALSALRWIAGADCLPAAEQRDIDRGIDEGIYSAEFEAWPHATLVEPLVRRLTDAVFRKTESVSGALGAVESAMRTAGAVDPT